MNAAPMNAAPTKDTVETLRALEHEVTVMVRRIKRVVAERARAIDPTLMPVGLIMLGLVHEQGPVRQTVLVETLGMDKAAISRQVQHLLDLGLVVREPDPADGRAQLLTVTADGEHRLARVADERRAMLEQRLSDWSPDDLGQFVALLARYNRSLS